MDGLSQMKLYNFLSLFIFRILPDLIQIFLLWKIYKYVKED